MTAVHPIDFGSIAWEEDSRIFGNISEIADVLNDQIVLSRYGKDVLSIFFVPMGLQPDDDFHPEKVSYSPKRKELDIRLKLDYARMKKASGPEFLRMVAQLFLSAIDRFPVNRLKDFDVSAFKEDVARIFREKGYLPL